MLTREQTSLHIGRIFLEMVVPEPTRIPERRLFLESQDYIPAIEEGERDRQSETTRVDRNDG